MAGDWIKMRKDLRDDPAVILIAERLGIDQDSVVGKLHRFWCWADSHTQDGNAPSVTESWIDRYVCVTGFARVMVDAGWLTISEHGLGIPNFARHNGQTSKARALTAERVQRHRNAPSVTRALPEKRREEKRREESEKTHTPPPPAAGGAWSDSQIRQASEQVYHAYPRPVGRSSAIKASIKAIKVLAVRFEGNGSKAFEWLLGRVRAYASSPYVRTTDKQYVPHPATWLNSGRYDDHDSEWAARPDPKSNGEKPYVSPRRTVVGH